MDDSRIDKGLQDRLAAVVTDARELGRPLSRYELLVRHDLTPDQIPPVMIANMIEGGELDESFGGEGVAFLATGAVPQEIWEHRSLAPHEMAQIRASVKADMAKRGFDFFANDRIDEVGFQRMRDELLRRAMGQVGPPGPGDWKKERAMLDAQRISADKRKARQPRPGEDPEVRAALDKNEDLLKD